MAITPDVFSSLVRGRLAGRKTSGTDDLDQYIANELYAYMYELAGKPWLPPFYNLYMGFNLNTNSTNSVFYPAGYAGAQVNTPGISDVDKIIAIDNDKPVLWNPTNPALLTDFTTFSESTWTQLEVRDFEEMEHVAGTANTDLSTDALFVAFNGFNIQLYPKLYSASNSIVGMVAVPVKTWHTFGTSSYTNLPTWSSNPGLFQANPWFSFAPMMMVSAVAARIAGLYLKDTAAAQILDADAEKKWTELKNRFLDQEAGQLSMQDRQQRITTQ